MSKTPRVSSDQRRKMLEYMVAHEDLARGRVAGADASRRKSAILGELASVEFYGGWGYQNPRKVVEDNNIQFTVDVVGEEVANNSSTRPEESQRATKNNSI